MLRFSVLQPIFRRLLSGGLLEFSLWLHPVSKTSVWNWIRKFEEKLPVVSEKKRRYLIALDETVVKSNKKAYYVYSAVDVEKNELILMRVYTNRNYLVSRSFLKEVLKFCEKDCQNSLSGFIRYLKPLFGTGYGNLKRNCLLVSEKKRRYLIALDETVVKANKKTYYVYSTVDVEKNELILMRIYTNRNCLVSRSFLKEVREKKPKFIVDKAPWLINALKSLDLEFEHQTFRREKPG